MYISITRKDVPLLSDLFISRPKFMFRVICIIDKNASCLF